VKIAIVGATGLVGQTLLSLLENSSIKPDELLLLGSKRSKGIEMTAFGTKHPVQVVSQKSFQGVDIAFFAVENEISLEFIPRALEAGAFVVDKSSAFRMKEDVPLVVMGVNEGKIGKSRLVANPNCVAIALCHVIYPLLPFAPREINVATYQSLSGAGKEKIESFISSVEEGLKVGKSSPLSPEFEKIFQVVPAIGKRNHLEFEEEKKLREESTKILNLSQTDIYCTCVRVPTIVGHCLAIFMKLEHRASLEDIKLALAEHPYVELLPDEEIPDSSLAITVPGKVVVGRLRAYFEERSVNLFAVSNNLIVGAAQNALEIAEYAARIREL